MLASILGFHLERSLTVVQLATAHQDTFQYISSSKAIKENLLEVREVNAAGSVNSLLVLNKSTSYVFMMDGDILAGAKQNRVVNTSILLAPESKTVIPVSCVEQGRWNSISQQFSPTSYTAPAMLRARKARSIKENLEQRRGHQSNQSEVWDDVVFFQRSSNVDSVTSNLSDVFDTKANELDTFIGLFPVSAHANGLAVFVKHDLLCIDIFNRTDIYAEYFPRILRGVALETLHLKPAKKPMEEAEAKYRTLDFLDNYDNFTFSFHDGIGVGTERRFDTDELTGCELRHQEHMLHMTALRTGKPTRSAA